MTNETKLGNIPPSEYYERPYIPSVREAMDYSSIPLLPVEAHTILVDNMGKSISEVDRIALQRISELDESDFTVDFKQMRKQVAKELNMNENYG